MYILDSFLPNVLLFQDVTLLLITSLRFLLPVTVSQTFLVLYDLENFEIYWSDFFRMPHNMVFFNVFLMIRLELWDLGRKITEVKCRFHHIISRLHTVNMTYHCWCLVFIGFFHCKVIPSLPHCTPWKEVAMCSPHLWSPELYFTSLSRWSPQKLFPTYIFVQSFYYVTWIHRYLFYSLGYNLIPCFFFILLLPSFWKIFLPDTES